jgi:hypothetical protein
LEDEAVREIISWAGTNQVFTGDETWDASTGQWTYDRLSDAKGKKAAREYPTYVGSVVARPSPPDVRNAGPIGLLPNLPGLLFPYFDEMIEPDSSYPGPTLVKDEFWDGR